MTLSILHKQCLFILKNGTLGQAYIALVPSIDLIHLFVTPILNNMTVS